MLNAIEVTKKEISLLEADHQFSDDSSEEFCDGSETPNIGDDISLEDLTGKYSVSLKVYKIICVTYIYIFFC